MNQQDIAHAWWSRLRHQGLLLSPVVMLERFPAAPEPAPFHKTARLRHAYTRFISATVGQALLPAPEQSAILAWTDALLENYIGHSKTSIASQHSIPQNLTAPVRIGNKSDTIRPHRVVFADDDRKPPALLVMADTSHIIGRGKGRTAYTRFLELLRGEPATAWDCSPMAVNSGWSMRAWISSRGASGRATAGSTTATAPKN